MLDLLRKFAFGRALAGLLAFLTVATPNIPASGFGIGQLGAEFGHGGSVGAARPAWVQPGAIIDEIFTTGQYWPRPIATELVDTRPSSKYVTNSAGVLVPISSNVLPISDTGMLYEPAATNLALQSQNFLTTWTVVNATRAGNAAVAPDGTTTASQLIENSTMASHDFSQTGIVVASGSVYTASIYLKGNGRTQAQLQYFDGTANAFPIFSLADGSVVSANGATSTSFKQLANGLWRFSLTKTAASTSGQMFAYPAVGGSVSYLGDGASGLYAWGAQLELGSAPSSYMPTTTTSATRAADSAVVQRTGIGRIVFTFDDNSQQTVSGINTAAQYTIPATLNRPLIKRMTGYAS